MIRPRWYMVLTAHTLPVPCTWTVADQVKALHASAMLQYTKLMI
jgi:hypothetical protein